MKLDTNLDTNLELPITLKTHSAQETQRAGETFAAHLQNGVLICLSGDLGAGKTTWTQGVARALGIEYSINSPTFVLMNEHHASDNRTLLHLDAYRLENADQETLRDAGIFDFLERDDAIKIVEWPQFIAPYLPPSRFEIHIENMEGEEDARRISIAQTSTR